MSKTIRIKTIPNGTDNYLKIKLEQEFDFLEVLSLKISQEDAYRKFSSDYGVIVGRVIVNGGFGVPNAKVSVFIPLDNIDKNDPLISGLYPFETITTKNSDGIRYNLLPKESEDQNNCFTPIGSFPSKREVLDNEIMSEIYSKYYKFTTTTNHAGDFMIFGVPLGTYTVHVDADISDIGIISQRPYDLITKGVPVSSFDSSTKFSKGTNLNTLMQIKSLDAGVNVQPFWGDIENDEIGITRLDLDLNYNIEPSAIFMGGIYGDHDKNSVNKRCAPRAKLGEVKEQVSSEGTIRMIRKTYDNKIEEFNVDGGELIDENGAWAYQIPMNLDYMITDEDGRMILSHDPNIGIPTRARVRFNIGMKNTGGEGRLRTRARYLVPNNPKAAADIDYEFGNKTNDKSFRDLHWNKIYSVSNFISRYQRTSASAIGKKATGIKDVDGSDGNKTPFPYNRINSETNPLFFVICLILEIILLIIAAINATVIFIINFIINVLNNLKIVFKIFGRKITIDLIPGTIDCISCIGIKCDEKKFVPGCSKNNNCGYKDAYNDTGADDCLLTQIARALNIFQFDFYNDWVNGSLYNFLLKYKKRSNKQEKFCEYNCDDLVGGGVDGNKNGVSDNNCHSSRLIDTGIPVPSGSDVQNTFREFKLNEGLIKKYNNEFFYAATNKTANIKIFATELINLGSVFDCDWQGIPKIQKLLTPTSYILPPDTVELDDNGRPEVSGMAKLDGAAWGLFFGINCGGIHVDTRQILNIRHICEMGVGLDETTYSETNSSVILEAADGNIGFLDMDEYKGKWFRDVFLGLNNSTTPWDDVLALNLPYNSEFNISNQSEYNFVSTLKNGDDYINFRNYGVNNVKNTDATVFGQPDHSFYFYFGLEPGKTGLDKMNKKFFTECIQVVKDNIIIESNSTPSSDNTANGSIIFSFLGGIGPFTYTILGINTPNGLPLNYTSTGTVSGPDINVTISNLFPGTYSITGIDSVGTEVTDIVTVNGPIPLYCNVSVLSNATSDISTDGKIIINNVGGGIGTIQYQVTNTATGAPAGTPSSGIVTGSITITNLAVNTVLGYTVRIYDSTPTTPVECVTTNLLISGPSNLVSNPIITQPNCFGDSTGTVNLNITGGQTPYTILVNGPSGYQSSESNLYNLGAGTYSVSIIDALAASSTFNLVIASINPELKIAEGESNEINGQCGGSNYNLPIYVTAGGIGGTNVDVEYMINDETTWTSIAIPFVVSTTPILLTVPKSVTSVNIRIKKGTSAICYSNEISYDLGGLGLPPVELGINDTANAVFNNNKQCSTSTANYNFTITHLDYGFTQRVPYTIEYMTDGSTVNTLTHYTGLVTLNGTGTGNIDFNVKITDSAGCIFPSSGWYTKTITLPTTELTAVKTSITDLGGGQYSHKVTASGGFAPYTCNGIAMVGGVLDIISPSNSAIICNIIDNYGCQKLLVI